MNSDWKTKTYSFSWLRDMADPDALSTFDWLKDIGVVPADVATMQVVQVRLDIDPNHIPAGYLAASAYEWDTWGPSEPDDLLDALEVEIKGDSRTFVALLLTALGREVTDAAEAA